MRNPWLTKNPLMSMWLSAANTMMGGARSRFLAEAHRQSASMMAEGTRQMMKFWFEPSGPAPRKRRKRSR